MHMMIPFESRIAADLMASEHHFSHRHCKFGVYPIFRHTLKYHVVAELAPLWQF